jgi:hypothetical protein
MKNETVRIEILMNSSFFGLKLNEIFQLYPTWKFRERLGFFKKFSQN